MGMSYHDTEQPSPPDPRWSAEESRPVALYEGARAERVAGSIEQWAIGVAAALLCLGAVGVVWLIEALT
jgi:hypothetical protein